MSQNDKQIAEAGRHKHHHRHHHRRHRVRNTILIVLGVFVVAILGYIGWFYFSARSAINDSYKPAGEKQQAKNVVAEKKSLNILLMGADTGALGRTYQGRTDTMIIATINPKDKKPTMTSIPRDTMGEIVGAKTHKYQRLNAAYEIGGSAMALSSISKLVNLPIQYYVTVNMGGLTKIVDAVGGVDVNVPFDFTYEGISYTKGKMHLNGKQALGYSRMRYDDPKGDYGRQDRQREVIISAVKAAVSTRTLTNFQSVLSSISKNMISNLSFDDMVSIFTDYRSYAGNMVSDYLQGVGAMWGDAMIQIPSTSELQRVSDNLREQSGLKQETINNEETRQNALNEKQGFKFEGGGDRQQFTVYPASK